MLERDIAKSGPTSNPVTGGGVCISNVFPLIRGKNSGLRVKLFRLPFLMMNQNPRGNSKLSLDQLLGIL